MIKSINFDYEKIIKNKFDFIGYILLISFFVVFSYKLATNMDILLDSDMSSEILYGKLLVENKKLFLSNWYYSTGIETLDTPLVFASFFLLTNNWHIVRVATTIILDIGLFFSFRYLCKQLKIKHISWLALFIVGSVSNEYFDFVLKGVYYTPYIIISFITIGLLLNNSENKNTTKIAILMILSLLSGLNGIRQLAQCYSCYFGASLLVFIFYHFNEIRQKTPIQKDRSFNLVIISLFSLLCSIVGYLINVLVLEKLFSFKSDWSLNIEFSSFNRIKDIVYGWFTMFGYESKHIWTALIALFVLIVLLISIIDSLKKRKDNLENVFVLAIFLIATMITISIFVFTNMNLQIRYFIQVFIYGIFVIGLYLDSKKDLYKEITYLLLSICIIVCSFFQLNKDIKNSTNDDLVEIKEILLKEKSYEGYASFWNANVITELSNGIIDVWNFHNYEDDDVVDLNNLDRWLQKKEHFDREPNGKVFLILTNSQNERAKFNDDITNYICFEGKTRVLYIFDNINTLISMTNK